MHPDVDWCAYTVSPGRVLWTAWDANVTDGTNHKQALRAATSAGQAIKPDGHIKMRMNDSVDGIRDVIAALHRCSFSAAKRKRQDLSKPITLETPTRWTNDYISYLLENEDEFDQLPCIFDSLRVNMQIEVLGEPTQEEIQAMEEKTEMKRISEMQDTEDTEDAEAAEWEDIKFYQGTITKKTNHLVYIRFDGDNGETCCYSKIHNATTFLRIAKEGRLIPRTINEITDMASKESINEFYCNTTKDGQKSWEWLYETEFSEAENNTLATNRMQEYKQAYKDNREQTLRKFGPIPDDARHIQWQQSDFCKALNPDWYKYEYKRSYGCWGTHKQNSRLLRYATDLAIDFTRRAAPADNFCIGFMFTCIGPNKLTEAGEIFAKYKHLDANQQIEGKKEITTASDLAQHLDNVNMAMIQKFGLHSTADETTVSCVTNIEPSTLEIEGVSAPHAHAFWPIQRKNSVDIQRRICDWLYDTYGVRQKTNMPEKMLGMAPKDMRLDTAVGCILYCLKQQKNFKKNLSIEVWLEYMQEVKVPCTQWMATNIQSGNYTATKYNPGQNLTYVFDKRKPKPGIEAMNCDNTQPDLPDGASAEDADGYRQESGDKGEVEGLAGPPYAVVSESSNDNTPTFGDDEADRKNRDLEEEDAMQVDGAQAERDDWDDKASWLDERLKEKAEQQNAERDMKNLEAELNLANEKLTEAQKQKYPELCLICHATHITDPKKHVPSCPIRKAYENVELADAAFQRALWRSL